MSGEATDKRFLSLAIALSRRALGQCWPNPAVGCVLTRGGRIVGRGITQPGGRPHAEQQALKQAGSAARGATAYVSLEPCAHHGKTPPCAEALVSAGVVRVVAALQDPDPRVNGQGFDRLRAAGIEVVTGLLKTEAAEVLGGFISRHDRARPELTLKLALSLDGRIATASGHSKWITGPLARRAVHALRARHDAVMVGAGTARADDPSLTVRDMGLSHQPVRVVVSRRLDLPLTSKLAQSARDVPLWLCSGPDTEARRVAEWGALGADIVPCALAGRQVEMRAALTELGKRGLTRVLCEGGGALAASLLAEDLVDEVIVFSAGLSIGAEGLPGLGALGLDRLENARRFNLMDAQPVGDDIMHRWRAH
ncbi:MAG: bifunctional diaminohydroxyphosphoribosylaminopyrimidine deaminase/5-amino-6-(5-phosphoribosylamino)uracil reductase RibD [Pseudomonadota bacterium]